jgi:hypothetical protein
LANLLDLLVDRELDAIRADELPLSIRSLEDGTVIHDNLLKSVREVVVCRQPLLRAPVLVRENDFDKQEIRERVAYGLVDEVDAGAEDVERFLLARK